jgi:type I restriction enzyme R subunit
LPTKPEAFSRVLIDQALRESGWDLLDDRRVRFELDGKSGRADYVLTGERGPLCVLEAKRPDLDPYEAKEQARGYAENLHAPFVILSNGNEHWFWNYERADQRDAFRIERLPSLKDLEAGGGPLVARQRGCRTLRFFKGAGFGFAFSCLGPSPNR